MSAVSMANLALARRAGVESAGRVVDSVTVRARAADGRAGNGALPENAITGALKVITSYIPTEVITVYVAGASILFKDVRPTLAFFVLHLVMTPVVVWAVFASKLRTSGQPLPWSIRDLPIWEMFAASVAFGAWAAALQQSPFTSERFTPEVHREYRRAVSVS